MPKRILCVDNSEDTRLMLTTMLGMSDLEAISVSDVTEALQLMKREQFSLYVLDGQLLGVSGLTVCDQIRAIDKDTPIVIFSGRGYQIDIDAGMLSGANAYIVKPDSSELMSTVKRLLEDASDPRANAAH
jgi:DNA-binding response OmpR family regulator